MGTRMPNRNDRRFTAAAMAAVLAALLLPSSARGYGSPNYNDMATGEISFHLEYPNKIHTWAVLKALELLRTDGYPGLATFAEGYLLPMLLGNAWNDHWGDRVAMTEGVLLDYFKPDPSEHNNGYGNPDGDIFTGIDHSTDEFAACPFWGVENAGEHAELRLQQARRACTGRWGEDPHDRLAGYVLGFKALHPLLVVDPIDGAYTDNPNGLPWKGPGKLPALLSGLLATGTNTRVLFEAQADEWLSTIHVPKPAELHDRDDWLELSDAALRGYMGPDGGGKHAYFCFAGGNGLGIVFWVPPDSLAHAFFLLGWATHLVQDASLPMHATDDAWDTFNAFKHNDFEDVWGAMLTRDFNTHIGGPRLKDVLPVSTADTFRSLYVFPPQRTPGDSAQLAVDPAPMFRRRWYPEELAPMLRPGEGIAHGYVRVSAEMAEVHLPYMDATQDEPTDEDAPFSLGFLLVWCTDLAIKTTTGMLFHFLTDVVQVLEGEIWDGHAGPLQNTEYPYRLVGDVVVPAGKTLTIGPGATVVLPAGRRIVAYGTLVVDGRGTPVHLVSERDPRRGLTVRSLLTLKNGATLKVP